MCCACCGRHAEKWLSNIYLAWLRRRASDGGPDYIPRMSYKGLLDDMDTEDLEQEQEQSPEDDDEERYEEEESFTSEKGDEPSPNDGAHLG